MQKIGGLAISAYFISIIVKLVLKITQETIWESFQITLPVGGTVVAFCGRISALGRWNLQMFWYKCPGVPGGQPPGLAADKCIIFNNNDGVNDNNRGAHCQTQCFSDSNIIRLRIV